MSLARGAGRIAARELAEEAGEAVLSASSRFLFRGTTEGFPGSAALQKLGLTPASTDPVVATLFATEAANSGTGVVLMAGRSGLPTVPGNVLAALEAEVGVVLSPAQFAERATSVSLETARSALSRLGVQIPARIADKAALDAALRSTPRLSSEQVAEFVRLVSQ